MFNKKNIQMVGNYLFDDNIFLEVMCFNYKKFYEKEKNETTIFNAENFKEHYQIEIQENKNGLKLLHSKNEAIQKAYFYFYENKNDKHEIKNAKDYFTKQAKKILSTYNKKTGGELLDNFEQDLKILCKFFDLDQIEKDYLNV